LAWGLHILQYMRDTSLTLEPTTDGSNYTGYVLNADKAKVYYIQHKRKTGHFNVYKIGARAALLKGQVSYTEALKTLQFMLENNLVKETL
jgi:hypothetical protein